MAVPTRPAGWPLWSLLLGLMLLIGIAAGFIYIGRSWEPVHAVLSWLGRPRREHVPDVAPVSSFEPASNGHRVPWLPVRDEEWKKEQERLRKLFEEQQRINAKILAELEALKKHKSERAGQEKTSEKPKRERAKAVYVANEQKPPTLPGGPLYTLAVWEYIPCVLENVLNSEIPGTFTVKITRPVLDATRQHVLIPQGQRVGAKDETADLLFGNERIPTFALSVSLPNGQALELGDAPIMDAAGTNGLTGDVNNHIWRLVWTSVFIGGLRGGQQVLQTQMGSQGVGPIVGGISREGSNAAQQRLGRAQDTRPTITVHSGELCNILIPQAMQLPSFAAVPR